MKNKAKEKNNKKKWLIIILISILFIPAFYGAMYLKSYWNDDNTFNKVPIAVVNLDQPYIKDGTTYNIGSSVINNLKSNTTLGWRFVNYNEAREGLYGTKYYAMLVIPKDFSEKIANATADGFKKPKIEFYENQGKNFVFSEIAGFGAQEIQESVAQSISKSVSAVLVQTIYKTKDGFKAAASGVNALSKGVVQLKNGSNALTEGMNKLQAGSGQLANGVDKLHAGSGQLVNGVSKLQNGTSKLANGTDKLQDGTSQLVEGTNKLQAGSNKLVDGTNQLQGGAQSLVSGMQKLSDGAKGLETGVNKLQVGSNNLSTGIGKLNAGATQVVQGETGVTEELQELQMLIQKGDVQEAQKLASEISKQSEGLKQGAEALQGGITSAQTGANELNNGLQQVGSGVSSLGNGIESAQIGAEKLNGGIAEVATGASALNNGLISAKNGANALNAGVGSLKTGANALNNGVGSLKTGANALNNGLASVGSGANSLEAGLSSAKDGAGKLSAGLGVAGSGVEKLGSGLTSGYNNLNENVKFSAEAMSSFIANPISLNTIAINPVSSYGEGFAPYFMSIGLWVGAMYVYFMVSALSRKFKGKFRKRFLKMYLIGFALCAVQAIIMSAIVQFGLGMAPKHVMLFYLVNIITIGAIYSLFNGLHYIITPIMKGAIMILMVFQFTSCGGSYPVLMMPLFYRILNKFAILTYSVGSMRMAISGINYSVFRNYIIILVLFIVVPTIIGYLVGEFRNYKTHRRVLGKKSELVSKEELFNQYV